MIEYFLGIDPAKENIGLVLCRGDRESLEPLAAVRLPYVNDKVFIQKLTEIIIFHNIEVWLLNVSIERQPHNSVISSNMRYVQGYLTGIGAKVSVKMPMTYRMKISTHKERKEYSLSVALERLNSSKIKNPHVLYEAIRNDVRKHDIADGFNLAFDLWSELSPRL